MAVNKIVTKVDGVINKTINFNDLKSGLAAGSHTITVEAWNGSTLVSTQTRNITIASSDTTAPTITTATVEDANPDKLVVVFSEVVTITNITGLTITGVATPTLSAPTGSGTNTITFTLSAALTNGQSVTLNVASSNTIKDAANNALAATTIAITNNVAAVANYLINNYPNAAYAFDFYKLNSAYTGACIRVRRADNVEQDIGFSGDALDQSALTTFAGASDCFLATWYDQSGNARNMVQSAATSQPKIVSAGAILKEGTKVTVQFDGVNDFMTIPALSVSKDYHQFFVNMKLRNANTEVIIIEQSANYNNTKGSFLFFRSAGAPKQLTMANVFNVNSGYLTGKLDNEEVTSFKLFTLGLDRVAASPSNVARVNGVSAVISVVSPSVSTMQGISIPVQPYYIGARSGGTTVPSQLNLSTLVLYASNQSANFAGIETKINSNYNLY